jgi:hypothetical protein
MTGPRRTESTIRPGSGIASRYRALLLTHGSLEEKLADEMTRPLPDAGRLRLLKRRKLLVKDELASIERLLAATRTRVELPVATETVDGSRAAQAAVIESATG